MYLCGFDDGLYLVVFVVVCFGGRILFLWEGNGDVTMSY